MSMVDTALCSSMPHANKHSKNIPRLCWSPSARVEEESLPVLWARPELLALPPRFPTHRENVQTGNCSGDQLVSGRDLPSHYRRAPLSFCITDLWSKTVIYNISCAETSPNTAYQRAGKDSNTQDGHSIWNLNIVIIAASANKGTFCLWASGKGSAKSSFIDVRFRRIGRKIKSFKPQWL